MKIHSDIIWDNKKGFEMGLVLIHSCIYSGTFVKIHLQMYCKFQIDTILIVYA